MTYTIKPELIGEILEIVINGTPVYKFDTNIVDPSEYESYYNKGFDWAFDVS